jgi:hypothetical protein
MAYKTKVNPITFQQDGRKERPQAAGPDDGLSVTDVSETEDGFSARVDGLDLSFLDKEDR